MIDVQNFNPDWTSSPGDTIVDILKERNISLLEFTEKIEQTLEETEALIEGRTVLTIGLARKLESFLGSSVRFWMSRDYQYRQDIARLELKANQREWLKELPVREK